MNTRLFGEIDIQKDKVICFENGIIGFPDYKEYALIYDSEKKDKKGVSWLQCLEDEVFALPVIDPLSVKPDYVPVEKPFLTALVSASFAFEGWIIATSINSEIKDSKRNLPIALVS